MLDQIPEHKAQGSSETLAWIPKNMALTSVFLPSLLGPALGKEGDAPASSPWGDKAQHLCWAHHLPKPSGVAGWSRWPPQASSCGCPHSNAPWVTASHSTSESSLESAGLSGGDKRWQTPRVGTDWRSLSVLSQDFTASRSLLLLFRTSESPAPSHLWVLHGFQVSISKYYFHKQKLLQ